MTSLLEERYRRVLRWLPASYRQRWEPDMVATFMERAYRSQPDDPEGVEVASPRLAEVADVAALAVRLRLGGDQAEPRSFLWGEAVRRVALIGLLAHALFGLSALALSMWWAQTVAVPGLWPALAVTAELLWLPAYLSVVFGHRRLGAILAVAAFLPMVVSAVTNLRADGGANAGSNIVWLLFSALPVVALAAFHRDAPAVRPWPWVLAVPIGVVVMTVVVAATTPRSGQETLFFVLAGGSGLWCAGIILAGIVAAVAAVRHPSRTPAWPLALTGLAVAVLLLHAAVLADNAEAGGSVLWVVGAAQCLALLATAGVLATVAVSRLAPGRERPAVFRD
jgi:hypothetical protein